MVDALRHERIGQEETHFFLSKLIEASPQGIVILNYDGIITELNPATLRIMGINRDDAVGKKLNELPKSWAVALSDVNESFPNITRLLGLSLIHI